jgi:hypothetical protein
MYSTRHYWVRLRWSKRRPYAIVRAAIRFTVVFLALAAWLLARGGLR